MKNNNQIIKIDEVAKLTRLSKSSIYRIKGFPQPIKLGVRSSGWLLCEIQDWIQQRMEAR
jgi:predicted DNA-binding transcriptional regulator AlpA